MEILKLLKTNHYIKNIVVFIPVIFSMNLTNPAMVLKAFFMFIAFCAVSSSIYIINDIIDVESDKFHPKKSKRPIASGKVSIKTAVVVCFLLFVFGTFIAYKVNFLSFLTVVFYLVLNLFYSFYLKKMPIIDASCIAFGFILRILSGCFANSLLPSPLVILMTFFVSMFFTFAKRKLELKIIDTSCSTRKSLESLYDSGFFDSLILANAILSVSFYFTYTMDKAAPYLYITTIPFALIIYRILFLINFAKEDDPIVFFENDGMIKILILIFLACLFVTIFSSMMF